MNDLSSPQPGIVPEPSVFDNGYEKEVLLDNWTSGLQKTMKAIFFIGVILLLSDLLALSMANALNGNTIIYILVVPLAYAGLGLLARKKPLLAIVIATLVFAAVISLNIYAFGARSIISGLLVKAFIIYFILTGFNHAREAEKARKDLALYP
jgi:hypothetical protein